MGDEPKKSSMPQPAPKPETFDRQIRILKELGASEKTISIVREAQTTSTGKVGSGR